MRLNEFGNSFEVSIYKQNAYKPNICGCLGSMNHLKIMGVNVFTRSRGKTSFMRKTDNNCVKLNNTPTGEKS